MREGEEEQNDGARKERDRKKKTTKDVAEWEKREGRRRQKATEWQERTRVREIGETRGNVKEKQQDRLSFPISLYLEDRFVIKQVFPDFYAPFCFMDSKLTIILRRYFTIWTTVQRNFHSTEHYVFIAPINSCVMSFDKKKLLYNHHYISLFNLYKMYLQFLTLTKQDEWIRMK